MKNKVLTFLLLFGLICILPAHADMYSDYQDYLFNLDDLTAYFPIQSKSDFTDLSGNDVNIDSWGVSNENTGVHSTCMTYDFNSFALISDPTLLPKESFSLVMWVNPQTNSTNPALESCVLMSNYLINPDYKDQGVFGFSLELTSDLRPRVLIGSGDTSHIINKTALEPIPVDEWTFLALVWDDKTRNLRLYVNGLNVQNSNFSVNSSNFMSYDSINHYSDTHWAVGRYFDKSMMAPDYTPTKFSPGQFIGHIDEIIIFDRPINSIEAMNLYRYVSKLKILMSLEIPNGPNDLYGDGVVYCYQGVDSFDLLKYRTSGTSWFTLSFIAKTPMQIVSDDEWDYEVRGTPCAAFRLTTDNDDRFSKNGRWWSDQKAEMAVVDSVPILTPSTGDSKNIAVRAGTMDISANSRKFAYVTGNLKKTSPWKKYYLHFPINWDSFDFTFKDAKKNNPDFIASQANKRENMRGIVYFYNGTDYGKVYFENIQLEVSSKMPQIPSSYADKDQLKLKYLSTDSKLKSIQNLESW